MVRYRHAIEATQAILLLNKQRFMDRMLEVKFVSDCGEMKPVSHMPVEVPLSFLDRIEIWDIF